MTRSILANSGSVQPLRVRAYFITFASMTQTVTLPIWLFVLILLFAAVTASTHFLFPSVRWFFRRRAERVVAELNKRLARPIQPFKLARRTDMIQRVIYDPDVVRAVGVYSAEHDVREDVGFEKAKDYAREIVPSFSASAYFGFAIRVARWLANFLFDVRLNREDAEALKAIDHDATVVFVMNHRSNFDYVLVTYLAAEESALSYAVGEWARVWPLSSFLRAMGAYFIRRRSRGALYRKVLASYVQKATQAGVTQAVFPEGGLSRTGMVNEPKLGILSYMVEGWTAEGRDIVFVPVSLNYDRVVEDRVLVAAGRAGTRRFRASAPEGIRFTLRYFKRRITGKVGKFGVAAVTFGAPLSMAAYQKGKSEVDVAELAKYLRACIEEGVPLVTAPLILMALFQIGGAAGLEELDAEMARLRAMQPETPSDETVQAGDLDGLRHTLDVMVLREILSVEDGVYRIVEQDVAAYYANSLKQHFSDAVAAKIPEISSDSASAKT